MHCLSLCLVLCFVAALLVHVPVHAAENAPKIPVILDTDIGSDIDDTWALALLLNCPEFDIRLVVSDTGDTVYRAKLIAKYLEVAQRTDIPVGVGIPKPYTGPEGQRPWVEDYDLGAYPGTVYADGVQAIIDTIMASEEEITLICIGPVTNIQAALERQPRIVEKARFVGMHGAVYKGYGGSDKPDREYNVAHDVPACKAALSAGWDITITPLDTCGFIVLDGERYRKIRASDSPMLKALMENYFIWMSDNKNREAVIEQRSSTLFDLVAIYLGLSEDLLVMKDIPPSGSPRKAVPLWMRWPKPCMWPWIGRNWMPITTGLPNAC